jgi:hypothetical protein
MSQYNLTCVPRYNSNPVLASLLFKGFPVFPVLQDLYDLKFYDPKQGIELPHISTVAERNPHLW